jgi:hypothetical protein
MEVIGEYGKSHKGMESSRGKQNNERTKRSPRQTKVRQEQL